MTRVLFVVSAANGWTLNDGSIHPTGYWAEELAEPHRLFTEAGYSIDIATPGGVAPTVDAASLGPAAGEPATREAIGAYLDSIAEALAAPLRLDEVDESDYDLVFYPGGHGPMEDLAVDPVSGALLVERLRAGRPLALLCHAPAAILAAIDEDGANAFAGRVMTGFSNAEERVSPLAAKAKWLLEDRMVEAGVDYVKGANLFGAHMEVDGALYTGQNPASSGPLAMRLIADLGAGE